MEDSPLDHLAFDLEVLIKKTMISKKKTREEARFQIITMLSTDNFPDFNANIEKMERKQMEGIVEGEICDIQFSVDSIESIYNGIKKNLSIAITALEIQLML